MTVPAHPVPAHSAPAHSAYPATGVRPITRAYWIMDDAAGRMNP
jgi:hypothetical protein